MSKIRYTKFLVTFLFLFMLCVESPCKPSLAQSEVCISDFDSAVLKRGVEWGSLHPSLRVYEVSKPFATHEGMWFAFLVNDKSSGKTHKSSTIINWRILAVSNDGKRVKQIQHINPLADFVESWPIGKSAIQLVVEQSEQGLSTRQQYQVDLDTQRCISITDPQLMASNEKLHPSLWSFPPINFAGSSQLFARPQIFRARFYDEYQRDSVSSITKGFEESTVVVVDNDSIEISEIDFVTGKQRWRLDKNDFGTILAAKNAEKMKLWTAFSYNCLKKEIPIFVQVENRITLLCADAKGNITWTLHTELESPTHSPVVSQCGKYVCGMFLNGEDREGLQTRKRFAIFDLADREIKTIFRLAWGTFYVDETGVVLLNSNSITRQSVSDPNDVRFIWRAPH